MLSIGEFSRVTGLTIKTIRLYDETGLLAPASVGDESGYRYYDAATVERARVVKQLRDLQFSLAEIAQILEAGSDEAASAREASTATPVRDSASSGAPSAGTSPARRSASTTTPSTRKRTPTSSRASRCAKRSRPRASSCTRSRAVARSRSFTAGRTPSYQRVFESIREKKLSPKVPSREVYLKGPGMIFKGNPKKYLTEIQVLVEE